MNRSLAPLALLALVLGVSPLRAETPPFPGIEGPREDLPQSLPLAPDGADTRAAITDALFEELAIAEDAQHASDIEGAIWELWMRSGSPTVDILMQRGVEALARDDLELAFSYFDDAVALEPTYAEAWNKRATIYYMQENHAAALTDVEHVLALEPRHFGALGGLAVMLEELGDKSGALSAYIEVLKVHPHMEGAAASAERLRRDVYGRGI